jgi:integrase/recombinase XerD
MKFCVIHQQTSHNAHSPMRVVEQTTDRGIGWVNRYLDREYVRRIADTTLRTYAHNLLHFVRWWESVHHTSDIVEGDLTESTLLEYVKFQSSQQPRPSPSTINDRVAVAERAIRNEFPDAPCQIARGFHQAFLRRRPMGLGRPRVAMSRLRVKVPKRNIVPLSVDEVGRFWSSFRTSRDLAIVGLMLLQGLRSAEVLALNRDDALLSEAQLRVPGKGNKFRFLPLAPETVQLLYHYLRLERPNPCSAALFVSLKGRARGTRMTAAGLRSLFRYHRQTTSINLANPHRFRHTFASDMIRAGMSLPALMQLMGHADIQTTLLYVLVTPQDVYLEYARAVAQHIRPFPKASS